MIPETTQLMLDFAPAQDSREGDAFLRVIQSESEYFSTRSDSAGTPQGTRIRLPRVLLESSLPGDPGGWRRRRQLGVSARELGNRVFQQLPAGLQKLLRSGTAAQLLRVAVVSSGTGLDMLPWEWLNGGQRRTFAACPGMRFVRLVPSLYAPPPLTVTPPLRVLVVITNPKDERLLRPDVEWRVVTQGLDGNLQYETRLLLRPERDGLREALEWSPHVLHYVGHAGISGSMGNIILHDDRGGTSWLSASEVARILPSSVRLLCLSTCVTAPNYQAGGLVRFAHAAAELALPTTIVNQYALAEGTSVEFWKGFYPALVAGDGDVVEAFHDARLAARRADDEYWDWASFSLVIRDGTGHPMRFGRSGQRRPEQFAAEIQAQWSARLANNLALRLRSVAPDGQRSLRETIGSEEARLDGFAAELKEE